jgi:high-affinity iron transporter
MAESLLIALREGFEAALVVAIVLAFVRREAPERAGAVWIGTASALALAVVVGIVLHATIDGLEGVARQRTFAGICLAAAALLTWMIFWMRRHARALRGELEGRAGSALASGSSLGLAVVAFAAVAREGLETALFLLSTSTATDGRDVVVGTLLGLAIATALGALVYRGSQFFDMRRFFVVTGALIILFAAGLLDRAVLFLQASGDIGTWDNAVYDLTSYRWLTQQTQAGRFLAGIFGWDPRPSIEQVVAYLAFLLPVGYLYFRTKAPRTAPSPVATGANAR